MVLNSSCIHMSTNRGKKIKQEDKRTMLGETNSGRVRDNNGGNQQTSWHVGGKEGEKGFEQVFDLCACEKGALVSMSKQRAAKEARQKTKKQKRTKQKKKKTQKKLTTQKIHNIKINMHRTCLSLDVATVRFVRAVRSWLR